MGKAVYVKPYKDKALDGVPRHAAVFISERSVVRRRLASASRGFSLIEVLIVAAIVLIISAIAIPSLLRARISANEASAVSSVRSVCSAQISYKMFYPDVGYASTLDALGPTGAALLDANLTTAPYQHSGYQYGSVGLKDSFTVTADPLNPGVTGVRSFCSDTPAAIYMATPTAGETCVIGTNPLR